MWPHAAPNSLTFIEICNALLFGLGLSLVCSNMKHHLGTRNDSECNSGLLPTVFFQRLLLTVYLNHNINFNLSKSQDSKTSARLHSFYSSAQSNIDKKVITEIRNELKGHQAICRHLQWPLPTQNASVLASPRASALSRINWQLSRSFRSLMGQCLGLGLDGLMHTTAITITCATVLLHITT